ncbi:hypothetical protein Tco_0109402 [Tanacetum coccineum]
MASDHVSFDPGPQCSTMVLEQDSLNPGPQSQENVPQVAETVTTSNELELLYSPMFSELLNGTYLVVSKSSVVHAADNPDKRQQHNTTHTSTTTDVADPPLLNIQSTHQTPTQVPTVTAHENIIQAETNTENAQFNEDEFINIFSTPLQERGETSSRHVDSSNMHTFYQHHPSAQRWTQKIHPLGSSHVGIQIHQSPRGIFINQAKYAQEILKKHGMTSCDSIGTPMATKHLDADLSGTPVDQTKYRSKIGVLVYLTTSRPDIVHATCYCACYQEKLTEKHLTVVAIAISCNPAQHSRTKYIDVRYHFIKEHVEKGIVELFFVRTEYQLADLFTKALSEDRFKYLVRRLGMRCLTPDELEVLAIESA